jgi:hypothetical protein
MKTPSIVHIIVAQAARHRARGTISPEVFNEHMRRLEREELEHKGLALLVRDLPDGRTRFLIKQRSTGTICDLLEFEADGTVRDSSALSSSESIPRRRRMAPQEEGAR